MLGSPALAAFFEAPAKSGEQWVAPWGDNVLGQKLLQRTLQGHEVPIRPLNMLFPRAQVGQEEDEAMNSKHLDFLGRTSGSLESAFLECHSQSGELPHEPGM